MSVPDAIAPEVYRQFANFEKLTNFFGYWPGFHDAEILFLRMGRGYGPDRKSMIAVAFHAFDWSQEPDTGRTVITHHCTVIFYFIGVEGVHLSDFGDRNVISELRFHLDGKESPPRIMVAFPAINGLDGRFTCGEVQVRALHPGIPSDSIYHA